MRDAEAKKREKHRKYRKCYIGLKVTSVPCHSDGSLRRRYTPRKDHHPFDTSLPQIGDNFFEDILVNPPEDPPTDLQPQDGGKAATIEPTGSSSIGSSPENLGAVGADYLKYTQLLNQDESAIRITKLPPVTPEKGSTSLKRGSAAPKKGGMAPSKSAAAVPRTHHIAVSPVVQSTRTALPFVSPQRSRKRPIVEEDEEEDELVKGLAKRCETVLTTPKMKAAKRKAEPARRSTGGRTMGK
jgi:hypothetical protein